MMLLLLLLDLRIYQKVQRSSSCWETQKVVCRMVNSETRLARVTTV